MNKAQGPGGPEKPQYIFLEETKAKEEVSRHAPTLFAGKELSWWTLATNLGFTRLLEAWLNPDYATFIEKTFNEFKLTPTPQAIVQERTVEHLSQLISKRTNLLNSTQDALLDGLPSPDSVQLKMARNKYEGPGIFVEDQDFSKIPENFAKNLIELVLTAAQKSGPEALDSAVTKLKANLEKPSFKSSKETLINTIDTQVKKLKTP